MAICFKTTKEYVLDRMEYYSYYHFPIHKEKIIRTWKNSDPILNHYGNIKWLVLDLINEHFTTSFCHKNWINKKKDDEIAYFLNEAGSNTLNHSTFKAPTGMYLWLAKNSCLIGLEQQGEGFNPKKISIEKKHNEGFNFFKDARNIIFFDDQLNAKITYFFWKN